jgi:hypothetical protein
MEKAEWKPFRNALDKSEKKQFDDMFDIPRLSHSLLYFCSAGGHSPYHYLYTISSFQRSILGT